MVKLEMTGNKSRKPTAQCGCLNIPAPAEYAPYQKLVAIGEERD
jgi:hypothetical protein